VWLEDTAWIPDEKQMKSKNTIAHAPSIHWTYTPPLKREGDEGKEREKLVRKFLEVCAKGSQNRIFEFVDDCALYEWEMVWPAMANERQRNGKTPLIVAASHGTPGVIDCLISLRAEVDLRDASGYTPLRYAMMNGHFEAMKALLEAGADPDADDICGSTLLMRAARLRIQPDKVVNLLLEHGALVNHGGGSGSMALHSLAHQGQVNALHAPLSSVHQIHEEKTPREHHKHVVSLRPLVHVVEGATRGLQGLHEEAVRMHEHVVSSSPEKSAKRRGSSSSKMKRRGSTSGKKGGNSKLKVKTVATLVGGASSSLKDSRAAVKRSKVGKTALMCAAEVGNMPVLNALLEGKADLQMTDLYGRTALDFAAAAQQQETIEVLFEAGVVLEKLSVRELVETDNQEVVTQLLYHGLKPDAEDEFDLTLLSYWSAANNREAMQLLLDKGANPMRPDRTGNSPLMLAAEKSSLEAMECLLEVGAKVDQTDTFGETALIHAARAAAHPAIRFLLDAKADLNKMDNTGRNAVSHAATSDQLETVRLLLELGAAVPEATIEAHEAQGSFWLPALVKEAQKNQEDEEANQDYLEQIETERLEELAASWLH